MQSDGKAKPQSGKSAADPPALRSDVKSFLAEARRAGPPTVGRRKNQRILFALDATASREPTWDLATHLHAELFQAAAETVPAATVQLVYYRGFQEFHVSPWLAAAPQLLREMTGVRCHGGLTQIARVLRHALSEAKTEPIKAAVFIGDACEEPHAALVAEAGKLALFNLPFFIFHEGYDRQAGETFRSIARITGGAYAPFAPGSASELRDLFGAVARYATEGRRGLAELGNAAARGLLAQLPP